MDDSKDVTPLWNDGSPYILIDTGMGCWDFNILNSTSIDVWDCIDEDSDEKSHEPFIFNFKEDGTRGVHVYSDGDESYLDIKT
jgi:hypothetical protein